MRRFLNLRNLVLSAVMLAAFAANGQTASAGNCRYYNGCRYEQVVTYRYERQPYTIWVTVKDEYGCSERVQVTLYRTVRVEDVEWVKVCH